MLLCVGSAHSLQVLQFDFRLQIAVGCKSWSDFTLTSFFLKLNRAVTVTQTWWWKLAAFNGKTMSQPLLLIVFGLQFAAWCSVLITAGPQHDVQINGLDFTHVSSLYKTNQQLRYSVT